MSLKEKAREVLNIIEQKGFQTEAGWIDLSSSIAYTLDNTITYNPESYSSCDAIESSCSEVTKVEITDETTQIAAARLVEEGCEDLVLLNFASARNPGGGFLNGAKAQEEDLSRCSILHTSLETQDDYYSKNREQSSMLYTDHAIYSPKVAWFRTRSRDQPNTLFYASVITSPAPNANQFLRKGGAPEDIESTLMRRSRQILLIAKNHGHRTVLLGAWGCGVFGNDPQMVANAFKHWLSSEFAGDFERVVFAVYDKSKSRNVYQAFKQTFGEK